MVEKKSLRDIIISLKTGLNPRSNFVLNNPGSNIPYITGKDIFENRINITEKTDMIDINALNLINKRACLENNLLLFASTGTGTVGRMAIINNYNNDWGMSETLYAIKTKNFISPYFLMYSLYSHNIKIQYEPKISKGSVPHLKVVDLLNVQIPIPSIQEQERIVGILDTFTSSIDNLKQQIAQRRKQYEYYRDQLLDLEGKEGVEMKTIGDLFVFKNGLNKEKKYFGKGTPIVNYTDVYHNKCLNSSILNGRVTLSENEIERFRVHKGDVFFTRTSETPEEVGYAAVMLEEVESCTFSGFLLRARPITNLLLPEFCAYCFGSYKVRQAIIKCSTFTTRALTNGPSLSKISVPVPSLSEQQRIVDILDKFEASIQNLEAQLSQREKQYEYYRNKLLTFED